MGKRRFYRFLEVLVVFLFIFIVFSVYSADQVSLSPNLKNVRPVNQFEAFNENNVISNVRSVESTIYLNKNYCLSEESISQADVCNSDEIESYVYSESDATLLVGFDVKLKASVDCLNSGKEVVFLEDDLLYDCNSQRCRTFVSYNCEDVR